MKVPCSDKGDTSLTAEFHFAISFGFCRILATVTARLGWALRVLRDAMNVAPQHSS